MDKQDPYDYAHRHLPSYPKAFVTFARLRREGGRVFVAMPFEAEHSASLWEVIHGVCAIHGLNVRRARAFGGVAFGGARQNVNQNVVVNVVNPGGP